MTRRGYLASAIILVVVVVTAAVAILTRTSAQETEATVSVSEARVSEAAYILTHDSLTGPEELEAGYHTFIADNQAEGHFDIQIVRLIGDATPEDIRERLQEVDLAYVEGDDPGPAINAALDQGELWGGPAADPGESTEVGIDLTAGSYVLLATVQQEGDFLVPMSPSEYIIKPLEVTAGAEAYPAPDADVTATMTDFAFALPPTIQNGSQLWEVTNTGEQIHHLVIARLDEGATVEDLEAFFTGAGMEDFEALMEGDMEDLDTFMEDEPPFEEVGYTNIFSPGVSNYVEFDLTPGTYVALCFMPDHRGEATGMPHFMLGMMQEFMVGE